MKTHTFIASVAGALCFAGPATAQDWQAYSTTAGHYSILFPGAPEESEQDDSTNVDRPFKIHFASYAPNDSEVYMAGWIDMTSFHLAGISMKELLENSRDGATGSMQATSVSTLATDTTGNAHIDFTWVSPDFVGKERLYMIHDFQYSLITIFSTATGVLPKADTFIASFTPSWEQH